MKKLFFVLILASILTLGAKGPPVFVDSNANFLSLKSAKDYASTMNLNSQTTVVPCVEVNSLNHQIIVINTASTNTGKYNQMVMLQNVQNEALTGTSSVKWSTKKATDQFIHSRIVPILGQEGYQVQASITSACLENLTNNSITTTQSSVSSVVENQLFA